MRKMTVLGASALLVAGLVGSPAAAFAAPIASAPVVVTPGGQETCPEDGKVEVQEDGLTAIEVSAEPGYVIVGYCVKAGAEASGAGLQNVVVDPPKTKVTISHESGKDISHYTVYYEPASTPTPSEPSTGPTPPGEEPTVEPTDVPTEGPTDAPTEPTPDSTDGTDGPTDEADEADATPSPSASTDEPPVLAATGASTVIGFTLIALALVGGGITLIVLRRKGVLGS